MPVPEPAMRVVRAYRRIAKTAPVVRSAVIVTVQVAARPVHPPDQPAKMLPIAVGVGVPAVTIVRLVNVGDEVVAGEYPAVEGWVVGNARFDDRHHDVGASSGDVPCECCVGAEERCARGAEVPLVGEVGIVDRKAGEQPTVWLD